MYPINPTDTRPSERRESGYPDDYESGPGLRALIVFLIVVALFVAGSIWIGNQDTADTPDQPVPTEAPIVPGS